MASVRDVADGIVNGIYERTDMTSRTALELKESIASAYEERERRLVDSVNKLLPFVKAYACTQKCLGKSCPYCMVTAEAEMVLAEVK